MSLLMAEAIADAAITYIRDQHAAKIADVAARGWGVTLDLPSFQAIRLSEPDREHEPDFPVLYVIPDTADVEHLAKGGAEIGAVYRFEFAVLAYHPGLGSDDLSRPGRITPAEAVKRRAMRYVLAVYEMLQDMYTAGASYHVAGQAVDWGTGGFAPQFVHGVTYASQSGEYLADARLVIGCTHWETDS